MIPPSSSAGGSENFGGDESCLIIISVIRPNLEVGELVELPGDGGRS